MFNTDSDNPFSGVDDLLYSNNLTSSVLSTRELSLGFNTSELEQTLQAIQANQIGISAAQPDLTITQLTAPTTVAQGSSLSVSYNLTNQGNLTAGSSKTKFYLSKNTTFDVSDTYLNSDYNSTIAAATTKQEVTYSVAIPSNYTLGNYYLLAMADGEKIIGESQENNNLAYRAITIVVPSQPDFTVAQLTAPQAITTGTAINIQYTFTNQGNTSTSQVSGNQTKFYLSTNTLLDSSDIYLNSDTIYWSISVGETRQQTASIVLKPKVVPASGTYYLIAKADSNNVVFETNENNNLRFQKITLTLSPDSYSSVDGYGLINASVAVAKALGQNPLADIPNLGGNYWGADLVKAPEVWTKGYTGKGIIVAVVDTGVDRNHPDLKANIWSNSKEIAGNGKDDDQNGLLDDVYGWNFNSNTNNTLDDNSHGTHVAGTIAAVKNNIGVTGIAYEAKIMPVKVLASNSTGSPSSVAKGIRYAADNGARVINLSLASSLDDSEIEAAVQYASSKGAIIVMAAGNNALVVPSYPARYATDWGIAVGAIDKNNQMASFSNKAGTTKLTYVNAPGVNVYSTIPNNQYGNKSGTSMATPHVAGVIALMLSAKGTLTPTQIRQILAETSENNFTNNN